MASYSGSVAVLHIRRDKRDNKWIIFSYLYCDPQLEPSRRGSQTIYCDPSSEPSRRCFRWEIRKIIFELSSIPLLSEALLGGLGKTSTMEKQTTHCSNLQVRRIWIWTDLVPRSASYGFVPLILLWYIVIRTGQYLWQSTRTRSKDHKFSLDPFMGSRGIMIFMFCYFQ